MRRAHNTPVEYPPLDAVQFAELERRLEAAEKDTANQMHKKVIEKTKAIADFEFQAMYYVRRLIEDIKRLRKQEA